MRKVIGVVCGIVVIALAAFLALKPGVVPAQAPDDTEPANIADPAKPVAPAQAPAAELPIARVVLYTSGVGYFERAGKVNGNARLDLSFPVQDINDLLKSMVLQDLGGGHVSAVSYDSHEPIDKTLGTFAVDLTNNPSFFQILGQARGEKVEVILKKGQAKIVGSVIGVDPCDPSSNAEPANGRYGNGRSVLPTRAPLVSYSAYSPKRVPSEVVSLVLEGKDTAEGDMLNLWCADGMRSVQVKDIERIRFLNPKMEEEMRRALEVLATAHDTQKKTVALNFNGDGQRQVKVGYVVENPLWRTSYRLLVGKDGKLFIQGWAVVENPSNEDWKDVRMTLVSGRPISFKMDLYQPLYVTRPVVQAETVGSVRPQSHAGAMTDAPPPPFMPAATPRAICSGDAVLQQVPPPQAPAPQQTPPVGGYPQAPPPLPAVPPAQNGATPAQQPNNDINLQRGVTASASAAELGSFFQYAIDCPVTVPRQKSAMIPIVNKPLAGAKVSLYNQNTHVKYPMLALQLKNTTGLHLMDGPITVFEGSSYAGDALLTDTEPGERRLVSYAVDTGAEVEPITKLAPERLISLRIQKGVLTATVKQRQSTTYTIKNRSTHDKVMVIEHPFRADYKLVSEDKPRERTREVYRFEVKVPAGKTAKHEVVEEMDQAQRVAMSNLDAGAIRGCLKGKFQSAKLKEALQTALEMHEALAKTQADLSRERQQLQTITQDQARLRANLKEMPSTSAAYKRYLQKFDTQETQIEKLQERIQELQAEEQQRRLAYERYLNTVDVESATTENRWPPGLNIGGFGIEY